MMCRPLLRRRAQSGFTLIEVLVALVVMAVGMLGIAGLYVEGLRAGRTAIYRTTAVMLAADMADRIRVNQTGRAGYAGGGPGANNGCVNGGNACAPDAMAADDWFRWDQDLQARLPAGSAANIAVNDLAPVTEYAITITWPESGQEELSSYTLVMQL